jgi:hypothetical protein
MGSPRKDRPDLEEHIQRTLAAAPPLTSQQRAALAELLRPARARTLDSGNDRR